MKVNDQRYNKEGVLWKFLVIGDVYVDEAGNYVLCTDEDKVVNLSCGTLYDSGEYSTDEDKFIPVNATLEIK